MQREGVPAGRGQSVGGASHTDAGIFQDDGRTGVENAYKLVPKCSMSEGW